MRNQLAWSSFDFWRDLFHFSFWGTSCVGVISEILFKDFSLILLKKEKKLWFFGTRVFVFLSPKFQRWVSKDCLRFSSEEKTLVLKSIFFQGLTKKYGFYFLFGAYKIQRPLAMVFPFRLRAHVKRPFQPCGKKSTGTRTKHCHSCALAPPGNNIAVSKERKTQTRVFCFHGSWNCFHLVISG